MNAEHRTSNVERSTTDKPQFEVVGDGLLVRAPGKINLSLLVAGEREDGYHNIESIMAKIDWYDEIFIEREKGEGRRQKTEGGTKNTEQRIKNAEQKTEDGGQRAEDGRQNVEHPTSNVESAFANASADRLRTNEKPVIELICKGEYKVPEGEENLVYKAARLILKSAGPPITTFEGRQAPPYNSAGKMPATRLRITLTKNMPAGSGLGSGSSDAAATLMGINKFFRMGLGKRELAGLAARLGSDVAFFLDGPMALCTGRGEKVKKLAESEFRVFLVVPDVSVSTKRIYENYRHDEGRYRRLREEINVYIEKKRIDLVCGLCANMLQESCFEQHPELGVLKKRIELLGIRPVCLSGSGSSMYCIINDRNRQGVETYRDKIESEIGFKSFMLNNNSW